MSSLTTLARPYAKAAFGLARESQSLARWENMLGMASAMTGDPSLADVLDNPMVSSSEVVRIMADTAGEAFDERFQGYLSVLAANERLPLLPEITRLFRQLREEAERRLHVRVVSAVPLDDDQAGRLRTALARRFERQVELENDIDSAVIGGAIVYAGDEVIDGSLRGRLQKLAHSLAN